MSQTLHGIFLPQLKKIGFLGFPLSLLLTNAFAGTPVNGITTFNNLYSGSYVDLTGTQVAGSTGLSANNVDGYNFKAYSNNNIADINIGIEPFTGQTALIDATSLSGQSFVTTLEVSSNGLTYFDLKSVDLAIDNVDLTSRSVTLTGYKGGSPVSGATLTKTLNAASAGALLVTFDVSSNTAFAGVNMFRVTVSGINVTAIAVDNVNAINFRSTLPLTLLSFSGQSQRNGVQLNWSTTKEIDTKDFDIERSSDAVAFSTIGSLQAKPGNPSLLNQYAYIDRDPGLSSPYFYRLKMQDIDGRYTYSPVVKVNWAAATGQYFICANPIVGDRVQIRVTSAATGNILAAIIDLSGKILDTHIIPLTAGNPFSIPVSNLPAGIYLLRLTDAKSGKTETLKILK